VLRGWRAADADAFAALNADPDVRRHLGDGRPQTRAQSDAELDRIRAHWAEHGFGLWCAAARAEPERCLGFVGLAIPSFLPAVLPAVEVGWRLAPAAWGRGLATEGAGAALAEAFGPLRLERAIAVVDPDNARSLRVAARLGMHPAADRIHPVTRRRLRVLEISAQEDPPVQVLGRGRSVLRPPSGCAPAPRGSGSPRRRSAR
jgi:RimJ/RimL family protein N-acetyltransferase